MTAEFRPDESLAAARATGVAVALALDGGGALDDGDVDGGEVGGHAGTAIRELAWRPPAGAASAHGVTACAATTTTAGSGRRSWKWSVKVNPLPGPNA